MTITYSIQNVTSELVHTVMIRKFFQMIFVGKDKKSLHIYTATVLGADRGHPEPSTSSSCEPPAAFEEPGISFRSSLEDVRSFRMKFEFAVGSADDNEVLDIRHEDLTSSEKYDFLNETECIRNVWGPKCRVIVNDQKALLEKYKLICPECENNKPEETTAALAGHKVLWTEQKKSGLNDRYLKSLSIAGKFEDVESPREQSARDEIAMRKAYVISVPHNVVIPKGIELVNWVRTTIQFKYVIDDTEHNYIIKKSMDAENKCIYYAPDFTWYFSPIMKSYIDHRNCMVEVKRGAKGAYETCLCPVQKTRRVFYRNDKFQNSINPVPNKLTVNFNYWINEEKIKYRQKYRLASRDIFPRPDDFNEVSEISIFLDASDEHNRGNRQFVAGIFLSSALAFGIDSSRINEVSYCFAPLNKFMTADLWWIVFLILFSLTLMNRPARLSEKSRKTMKKRRWLLLASAVWVGFVFGVLRSPLLNYFVEQYKDLIGYAMGGVLIILDLLHVIYLQNKNVKIGRSMLSDFFGEDLL